MIDIISSAAERHHLIILTCYQSAYRGLGGHIVPGVRIPLGAAKTVCLLDRGAP